MQCAVLGRPIAHSLSPVLHQAAYAALGLDWSYRAIDVGEAELPDFVASLDSTWRGLSLTMPLKQAVIDLCATVTDDAREVSAVNTVVRDDEGWHGSNTDIAGMISALATAGLTSVRSAVLVGAGATATSALAALRGLGVQSVDVWVRSPERARALVALGESWGIELSVQPLSSARLDDRVDVAISTVPAAAQQGSWVDALVARAAVVHDVVYDPWPTPLLAAARAGGCTAIGGFELLVAQAALQVSAMTGCDHAPVTQMRAAGLEALARR